MEAASPARVFDTAGRAPPLRLSVETLRQRLLWLTAWIAGWAVARFGERWGFDRLDDVASLPLLSLLLSLMAFLAQPAVNSVSRSIETEADVYGLEITRDNDAAALVSS